MEAEKISVPRVVVTTAKSGPATLPRTREGFAVKQEQIHLFREEMRTEAVEVKSTASSHFIITPITLHPESLCSSVPPNC